MARDELVRRSEQLEKLRASLKRAEERDDHDLVARLRASIKETEARLTELRGSRGARRPEPSTGERS